MTTTNVQTKTNQIEGGAPGEVTRAQQIARLSNEHLLMLRESVTALHRNLDSSFWYSALKIKAERDTLLNEVQAFKWELEEEYATRLLRGYHTEFQKLVGALHPPTQEARGRRLIPINATVEVKDQEDQPLEKARQAASDLATQLEAIIGAGATNV